MFKVAKHKLVEDQLITKNRKTKISRMLAKCFKQHTKTETEAEAAAKLKKQCFKGNCDLCDFMCKIFVNELKNLKL